MSSQQEPGIKCVVESLLDISTMDAPSTKKDKILYYSSQNLRKFINYPGLQDLFALFSEEKEIIKKRIDASIAFYNGIFRRTESQDQIKETLTRFHLQDFPVEELKLFYLSMFGQEPEIFASKRKADDQIGSASKRQRISSADHASIDSMRVVAPPFFAGQASPPLGMPSAPPPWPDLSGFESTSLAAARQASLAAIGVASYGANAVAASSFTGVTKAASDLGAAAAAEYFSTDLVGELDLDLFGLEGSGAPIDQDKMPDLLPWQAGFQVSQPSPAASAPTENDLEMMQRIFQYQQTHEELVKESAKLKRQSEESDRQFAEFLASFSSPKNVDKAVARSSRAPARASRAPRALEAAPVRVREFSPRSPEAAPEAAPTIEPSMATRRNLPRSSKEAAKKLFLDLDENNLG